MAEFKWKGKIAHGKILRKLENGKMFVDFIQYGVKLVDASVELKRKVYNPIPQLNDIIVVWFSCGAASAVAAKKTIEDYENLCKIRIVNNPIAEEHPDNQRFLLDVEQWLKHPIEKTTSQEYPEHSCKEVWDHRGYMSGIHGASCTVALKKETRKQWEINNFVNWHVLGFTIEEKDRSERFIKNERSNTLPILIKHKLDKQDCFDILIQNNIQPPAMYALGYPNANCIGCVKATSPTYWNHVRKTHPEVFNDRAEQSRKLGCRLVRVNNERIFLDELDPKAKGLPMLKLKTECGIFCEEE